jgi:DNA polymerase-3 subunit beta
MKGSINQEAFIQVLSRVYGVADRKNTIPILANVLLEVEDSGKLRISATDLHLSVNGSVLVHVKEVGSTTIPARKLYGIVRDLPESEINFSLDKNHFFRLNCGKVKYRIAGTPAEDFPSSLSIEDVKFFSIDSEVLKNMIEKTYIAISSDEGRPHLNAAFFSGEGKNLRMVSTDGHRMCLIDTIVEDNEFSFSTLIPLKGIQELRRYLNKGVSEVEMGATESHVFFRCHFNGVREEVDNVINLGVKLIDARFPPYERIIPRTNNLQVVVDRVSFIVALKRVLLIKAKHDSFGLKFVFSNGIANIISNSVEAGEASEEVEVQYEGEHFEIAFNGQYLLVVLQVMDSEYIELLFNGPSDACTIKQVGDDGFLSVLMPMAL